MKHAVKKVVCIGPGPIFKGGIANYTSSLALGLREYGNCDVHIVSWTHQYPSIVPRDFIDRRSKKKPLVDSKIPIHYVINYNNPLTWVRAYRLIKELKPDFIIIQWAITVQGIPLGWLTKWLIRNTNIQVIFDLHNIVQKESSKLDKWFTSVGIKNAHAYIVHSDFTLFELRSFFPNTRFITEKGNNETIDSTAKKVISLFHPVYTMFTLEKNFDKDTIKKSMGLNTHVFLFFGFIRRYKGLHLTIKAFSKVVQKRKDVSLLIAGEAFWDTLDKRNWSTRLKKVLFSMARKMTMSNIEDESEYNPLQLVEELGLNDYVYQHIEFIPNEEVHKYFQVSDALMLFYAYSTPSGVESIAYNFKLPVLATKVGNFPYTITDGVNGYLAEADDIDSMAETMLRFIDHPIDRESVAKKAENLSWENYVKGILEQLDGR